MKHYKDMGIKEQLRVDIVCYLAIVAVKFTLQEAAGGFEVFLISFGFFMGPIYLALQFFNYWKDQKK